MWDFFRHLFDTGDFPPRWHCGHWTAGHGWLHILSDIAVWSAYLAIPAVLIFFAARRRDLPFRKMFLLFGAFIFACGTTHLMEALIFWWPAYRLAGVIKLVTAVVSWGTVLALCYVAPKALSLRSPEELDREISDRRKAEQKLLEMQMELEQRVAERTSQLTEINASLQTEVVERRRAEEKFRMVVELFPSGMIMIDQAGTIVLVNSETEHMFGYRREELLGNSVDFLVPARFRGEHPKHRDNFMAAPEARSMGSGRDLYGVRKDASEFPVEIGLHPIRTEQGLFVLSAVVDITERKKTEARMRRFTLRLQRSNRELQDFAYVASHDLQEPLRKIQAFGDRLQTHCQQTLSDEGRDYVDRMQKAATRMRVLIEDMLSYSRIATKARPFVPVSLNQVVREVLDDLQARIESSGGHVALDELPTIDADPTQMRQLFQNLLGNALKFRRAEEAPTIGVRCSLPSQGSESIPDASCQITVEDNGIGFDGQYAERIFEMFQRLNERAQYDGSGIGLAICRKIVERHGGQISAQGRPGLGATFFITLPLRQTMKTEEGEDELCPVTEEASNC